MSRVGIFGGTFDPIHHGHLITAQSVREIRHLDKIIFIPSFISPHKSDIISASPEHRMKMLKLATKGVDFFEVSDYEIKKEGISYTIDTLKEFKKKYDKLEFIMGYDNIFKFHNWKEPDKIMGLTKVLVLERKSSKPHPFDYKYVEQAIFVETRGIEISATDIREKVKQGVPIHYLVPEKVKEYIYNFNLYK